MMNCGVFGSMIKRKKCIVRTNKKKVKKMCIFNLKVSIPLYGNLSKN